MQLYQYFRRFPFNPPPPLSPTTILSHYLRKMLTEQIKKLNDKYFKGYYIWAKNLAESIARYTYNNKMKWARFTHSTQIRNASDPSCSTSWNFK